MACYSDKAGHRPVLLTPGFQSKKRLFAVFFSWTPGAPWRREALKEEAPDDLFWKDERRPLSIKQTLEQFERQHWENFWERVGPQWHNYGLFSAHSYHNELDWSGEGWGKCMLLMEANEWHMWNVKHSDIMPFDVFFNSNIVQWTCIQGGYCFRSVLRCFMCVFCFALLCRHSAIILNQLPCEIFDVEALWPCLHFIDSKYISKINKKVQFTGHGSVLS